LKLKASFQQLSTSPQSNKHHHHLQQYTPLPSPFASSEESKINEEGGYSQIFEIETNTKEEREKKKREISGSSNNSNNSSNSNSNSNTESFSDVSYPTTLNNSNANLNNPQPSKHLRTSKDIHHLSPNNVSNSDDESSLAILSPTLGVISSNKLGVDNDSTDDFLQMNDKYLLVKQVRNYLVGDDFRPYLVLYPSFSFRSLSCSYKINYKK
jgi:hypothetical protein